MRCAALRIHIFITKIIRTWNECGCESGDCFLYIYICVECRVCKIVCNNPDWNTNRTLYAFCTFILVYFRFVIWWSRLSVHESKRIEYRALFTHVFYIYKRVCFYDSTVAIFNCFFFFKLFSTNKNILYRFIFTRKILYFQWGNLYRQNKTENIPFSMM